MSRRIGELLIDKELLSEKQLERALKAQLIFGGHLGTSLIELGYVDEATLGRVLSEINGVPYATLETVLDVPPPVIQTVPAKLAERFRIVPIRVRDRQLLVAAINPRDLAAMDTIAFATGYRVVPWVTPEIRIFQALEKYYGIARPARYVTICRELDQNRRGNTQTPAESVESVETPLAAAPMTEAATSLATAPATGSDGAGDLPPSLLDPGLVAIFEAEPVDASDSWQEVLLGAIEKEQGQAGRPPGELSPELRAKCLEQVAEQLAGAGSGDEVATAILSYLSIFAKRSILFAVRGATASVWRTGRLKLDQAACDGQQFPVLSDSLFELLLGNEYFRGPLPRVGGYTWIYRALDFDEPAEVLIVPVHVENRLTLIMYADGGPEGSVGGDTSDFLRLANKVSMALSVQILKNRIRGG